MRDYRNEAAAQFPYLIGADQRDHKAWAKRIMYREERKCSALTAHQVNEAKRALDIEKPENAK